MAEATTKDISMWEIGGINAYTGMNVDPMTTAGSIRIRTIGYVSGISRIAQLDRAGDVDGITVLMYNMDGDYVGAASRNVKLYADFDYERYHYRIELARNKSEELAVAFARYAMLDMDAEAEYYYLNPLQLHYKSPEDGLYYGTVVGDLGLTNLVLTIRSLDQEILEGMDEIGDDLISQVNALSGKYVALLENMDRVNMAIVKHFGGVFTLDISGLDEETSRLV